MPPTVSAAARRAKRVVESSTESSSPSASGKDADDAMEEDDEADEGADDDADGDSDEDDELLEDEDELDLEEEEQDGADGADRDDAMDGDEEDEDDGEDDDGEGVPDSEVESEDPIKSTRVSSAIASDDDGDFESGPPTPAAERNVKIKLRVPGPKASNLPIGGRLQRAAAQKAAKKTKRTAKEAELGSEEDELENEAEESGSRATSPSKMTARQRARQNKDLQDTLISLPDTAPKAKPILTEAERLQKREEMARRRKRQNEQRLQDEQDQTINRLLRAQTGRSRSKLDKEETGDASAASGRASGVASPTRKPSAAFDGVHWMSRMEGDNVALSVSVKAGHESWLDIGSRTANGDGPASVTPRNVKGTCAVPGCGRQRIYRSVNKFEVGGCSLAHLREVEKGLA